MAVPCPPAAPIAVALLLPEVETSVALAFAVKAPWASAKPKLSGVLAVISRLKLVMPWSPSPPWALATGDRATAATRALRATKVFFISVLHC